MRRGAQSLLSGRVGYRDQNYGENCLQINKMMMKNYDGKTKKNIQSRCDEGGAMFIEW